MTRPFRFKQFVISQDRAPMKVGTDGVLLGSWVSCANAQHALDIGAGTGLIALMLAQRNPDLKIVAIEPNPDALADAAENIEKSAWNNRIDLMNSMLSDFVPQRNFDLIVSNPPFFLKDLKSPDVGRSMARHAEGFDYRAFAKASEFLTSNGRIAGIYPVDIFEKFDMEVRKMGMYPQRICYIKPTPVKEAHRVLFEYGFNLIMDIEPTELVIETDGRHRYSPEYIELTGDFYLDF